MKKAATAAFLALVLGASGMAGAQTLYRWNDAEGKTHYGDRPPKDAINLVKVDTSGSESNAGSTPVPPVTKASKGSEPIAPAAQVDRNTQRRETRERLRADLDRALAKLELAKKQLEDGGDMQDDERQVVQQRAGARPVTPAARQNCRPEKGRDGKTSLMCPVSVPNDQYYDRTGKLEQAVRQAEEEVAAAETAYRRGVD
jgi:hypothetical protein